MINRFAVISRHIVVDKERIPSFGVILIEGERIVNVVTAGKFANVSSLLAEYADWNPIDLEDYYISPGLVDLNVRRDFEGIDCMTRIAALGGVSLVLDEESDRIGSSGSLYCDVGKAKTAVDDRDLAYCQEALAVKCYLHPPNSYTEIAANLDELASSVKRLNKLLIVDPLLPDDRMMHMASPLRAVSNENRFHFNVKTNDSVFAAAFPADIEGSSEDDEDDQAPEGLMRTKSNALRGCQTKAPIMRANKQLSIESPYLNAEHNIFTDLDKRIKANEASIEFLSKVEQTTYITAGNTVYDTPPIAQDPPPVSFSSRAPNSRLARFRPKAVIVEKTIKESDSEYQYMYYLANFPDHWEVSGVTKAVEAAKISNCQIHFANLSSATAVNKVLKSKEGLSLTCETAPHFLCFTDTNIEKGNTRLKSSPPIRNRPNCNLLWDLLKMKGIDCISSNHRAVPANFKMLDIGSFKRALPGIQCLGVSMQQVWTRLRVPCTSHHELEHYIVRLSKWMSLKPAQILGVSQHYGSIETNKFANLIVWSPHETFVVSDSLGQFPETFPYRGVTLYGPISKVMLRGQFVVDGDALTAAGKLVTSTDLS